MLLGTGGFGPRRTVDTTITRLYVDHGKESSHYMVSTDQGMFEVDNGFILGIWNADEIYGRFKEGKKYRITTKGNKVVGWFFQEYPYVLDAQQLAEQQL